MATAPFSLGKTKSRPEGRLLSLYAVDDTAEVFTDGGSTRQRLPNGVRDNARENRKGEAYQSGFHSDHLLSGGSQKKYSIFPKKYAILGAEVDYTRMSAA